MRTVALEEHFSVPSIASRIDKGVLARRGYRARTLPKGAPNPLELLPEIGAKRLKSMEDAGISVQVLSNSGPGPDLVPGQAGVDMARETNDLLAKAIASHPDRFAGFAALPLQSPDAAATEFTRAVKQLGFVGAMVHGTTEGRFLDHSSFEPVLAAAEQLDVPIYIHPHIPPEPVRQAYFSDLPAGPGRVLETAGWGWHSETAVHVLRMVIAGTLDKHPRLKRPISRTILDQVWITTSGIFDEPPFLAALLTFGIDRIMFSVDYPYSPDAMGREFLERIALAPADMAKLAHGNADALLKLKVK
jgi:predicted TIM-barrel fold metal-dependent hydrolase